MVNIRLATVEDLPRIFAIEQETISPPWTEDAIASEITREGSYFIVADDGGIKGFAFVRQVGYDGEILQIAVDKSVQRSGIGDLLMKTILEYADENNFQSVFLEVRYGNIAAINLYKKHGFSILRVRKKSYESPVEDALVMKRGESLLYSN